jgi:hypothetical protein
MIRQVVRYTLYMPIRSKLRRMGLISIHVKQFGIKSLLAINKF